MNLVLAVHRSAQNLFSRRPRGSTSRESSRVIRFHVSTPIHERKFDDEPIGLVFNEKNERQLGLGRKRSKRMLTGVVGVVASNDLEFAEVNCENVHAGSRKEQSHL